MDKIQENKTDMKELFDDPEVVAVHLERQFGWTKDLRLQLYRKARLKSKRRILDVGCGTGLISREMAEISGGEVYGIDKNEEILPLAMRNFPHGRFRQAVAEDLPFEDNFFDCVFCHFVLMWADDPEKVISEMKRVTRPGGAVIVSAEPDYGGKIEYPDPFSKAQGSVQTMIRKGADPYIGRKLKAMTAKAEIPGELGLWANLWDDGQIRQELDYIWKMTEKMAGGQLAGWQRVARESDYTALDNGEKMMLLSLFWFVGRKAE